MATNSEMNLDTINVMELSLPSSTNSSRPESPTITNCERLRAINKDIEKFGIVIESIKSSLRGLQIAGIDDVNDPTFLDQTRRLDDYIRLQQLAVSEFTSQPYCNTPGCTTHTSPSNSPSKVNVNRQVKLKIPLQSVRIKRMILHPPLIDKLVKPEGPSPKKKPTLK
ncbi:hypothetical protein TNIN_186711 [Trichonephila inaurata madagascariensis]|uniref:Uncharacterized protein n=1 Tax=Trichonephila inaurata madagascariensis TaxID=2747483 RepID=A0A8X6WYM9_9ARAC|nr:hypothetical protein TNIN_186711 [Trichonephila inaurata madagascariensis]